VTVPVDFSRKLLRGEKPDLLLEADATDPSAVGFAQAAVSQLATTVINRDLTGPLAKLQAAAPPFNLITHQHYNPESISQYNIVPGLMGVMLTMTMIIITGLAITRERERGTMENLLSTPAHPGEVIVGKIVPYIMVGYVQVALVLLAAKFLFDVPFIGSVPLLVALTFLFIVANLAVGITFSTIAKNQLQAVQMAFFFFLPSLLLSGYMFPFRGMPGWAQDLGECLPLTHFLRVVRGILLKGNGLAECAPDLWPIALFVAVMLGIGVKRYRQTLD
jgi:ABC-2 type transport system permease protein